jgi:hypothetical protein
MLFAAALCLSGCVSMNPHGLDSDDAAQVDREIRELHQFFEEWFAGSLVESDEAFARFSDVLTDGFTIVTPGGVELDRQAIMDAVRTGHGSDAGARIWIERVQIRHALGKTVVATYEEWQQSTGQAAKGRLSTVVFARDASTPNGLVWLHVHETWLPVDKKKQASLHQDLPI